MFISRKEYSEFTRRFNKLESDSESHKTRYNTLTAKVRSLDREIEELASNQRYDRGVPIIEVVRALVVESGKDVVTVPGVPRKIILATPEVSDAES